MRDNVFKRVFGAVLIAALLLLLPGGRTARATEHDSQLWFPVYLTAGLTDRWLGYFEINPRLGDEISDFVQLLIRPAIGYRLTPRLSLWQGYAWVTNYEPTFIGEHRIFQQAIYRRPLFFLRLMSRTRLEQRWIESTDGTSVRARQMFRFAAPIPGSKEWALVIYDEIFVNLNSISDGPESGFDQNRAFIGINRTFNRHVNVDLGYQNLAFNSRASGLVNRMGHIILIQTFINF